MSARRYIRSLLCWNQVWMLLILTLLLGWWAWSFVQHTVHEVRVYWEGQALHIVGGSDDPFVVTHLVRYADREEEKAIACLPEPIAVADSAGTRIDAAVIKRLSWRSAITGKSLPAPPSGAPITVLYYEALKAKSEERPPSPAR